MFLDHCLIVFLLDGGHGGLVDIEQDSEFSCRLRTVQGLVSLAHGFVLVLADGDFGVLDIGVGIPSGEHDRNAMLLLLDADIGFLGFVEKRINASLVAALVCMKPKNKRVETACPSTTREERRGWATLGIEEYAIVLGGILQCLGNQLDMLVRGFLFLVILWCHSCFT